MKLQRLNLNQQSDQLITYLWAPLHACPTRTNPMMDANAGDVEEFWGFLRACGDPFVVSGEAIFSSGELKPKGVRPPVGQNHATRAHCLRDPKRWKEYDRQG